MKKLNAKSATSAALTALSLCAHLISAKAAVLYVDDVNNSTTANRTYAEMKVSTTPTTFKNAFAKALSGDIIEFAPGIYNKTNMGTTSSYAVMLINRPTLTSLTLRAKYKANDSSVTQANRSVLQVTAAEGSAYYNILVVDDQNYVTVDGFEVEGKAINNSTVKSPASGLTATNGAHHITFKNNVVHDLGGAGIGSAAKRDSTNPNEDLREVVLDASDYIVIENNIVYNNCNWATFNPSGISLLHCKNFDDTDANFHNIIRGNKIYNNILLTPTGIHYDGNGIIVDTLSGNNPQPSTVPYWPASSFKDIVGKEIPRTLIENNISYYNGGRGIHVLKCANVTVRNNTTYGNNRDTKINDAELTVYDSKNIRVANNVVYGTNRAYIYTFTDPDETRYTGTLYYSGSSTNAATNIWRSNTYFNGSIIVNNTIQSASYYPTTIQANPQFYYLGSSNLGDWDFRPSYQTPNVVIDNGSTAGGSSTTGDHAAKDFFGVSRPQGSGIDRGAIERVVAANRTAAGSAPQS